MSTKQIPRDAQVIQTILKDMGIVDYEPRVVNQLLEFVYRKPPILILSYTQFYVMFSFMIRICYNCP